MSVAERVKKHRQLLKEQGLKKVEVYIKPEHEQRLKKYVKRYCQTK